MKKNKKSMKKKQKNKQTTQINAVAKRSVTAEYRKPKRRMVKGFNWVPATSIRAGRTVGM
jgi:hypothetical protein